jgi:hypothetical protein
LLYLAFILAKHQGWGVSPGIGESLAFQFLRHHPAAARDAWDFFTPIEDDQLTWVVLTQQVRKLIVFQLGTDHRVTGCLHGFGHQIYQLKALVNIFRWPRTVKVMEQQYRQVGLEEWEQCVSFWMLHVLFP